MNDLKWCRHCVHWFYTAAFLGNCRHHPWEKDRWSQSAEPSQCEHYRNKYELKEAICQKAQQ